MILIIIMLSSSFSIMKQVCLIGYKILINQVIYDTCQIAKSIMQSQNIHCDDNSNTEYSLRNFLDREHSNSYYHSMYFFPSFSLAKSSPHDLQRTAHK